VSEETERSDTYYEVQVDRETLVLLGFGFVVLLVVAFLIGRWTAPGGFVDGPGTELVHEALEPDEAESLVDLGDVDGEPLFGGSPVSAEGAPPIGAVPEQPLPEREREPAPAPEPTKTKAVPSRTATPPSVEPIPKAVAEGWVVQVSAVKSSRDAKALQKKLQAKGWPVRVLRESGFSKVQVGPFAKRSDADAAERRLKREQRLSTWVKHS